MKKKIEMFIRDLLKEYGLFKPEFRGPIFFKEELQKYFNFEFKEIALEDKLQGAILKGKSGVKIIVNSTIDNPGRKNFTYAHELGHYFLKHKLDENYNGCKAKDIEAGEKATIIQERQANCFASFFLLPKEYVYLNYNIVMEQLGFPPFRRLNIYRNNYNIWKIVCCRFNYMCGVSDTTLRYRLEELKLLKFYVE
ncbi:MAG TPA: ImmA/IrrE family metallo-endopeptidase [Clostridia bacterium]